MSDNPYDNEASPHLNSPYPAPEPQPLQPAQQRIRTAWTADELMNMQFPDPKWAVPGLISEGVNLLAGPPKVGKSWLSLGLALSVAAGGTAMDTVPVDGGPVLYLALEDTPRRLQSRMGKILGDRPAPSTLTLATSCPPIPQGGGELIGQWCERNPEARMIVIDVFAKIRGTSAPGSSAYDADYAAVGHVKRIADHYGIAVVLVHHVRKAGADDFLAEVSGTNGIAGAADATLVLKRSRGQADGVLHVTGRDVDESEYALRFYSEAGAWQLLEGPATDHTIGDSRATILRYVREHPGTKPKQIAEGTGLQSDLVRQTCSRMAKDVQLIRKDGGYVVPGENGGQA
ncbi:AAA family ATPase [Streptomyces sp. NPDC050439]|uniref:AAA family ATPase n=1 Tax=unclassified Streptomyces TaxID=2593676 RepID=UPI0034320DA8